MSEINKCYNTWNYKETFTQKVFIILWNECLQDNYSLNPFSLGPNNYQSYISLLFVIQNFTFHATSFRNSLPSVVLGPYVVEHLVKNYKERV